MPKSIDPERLAKNIRIENAGGKRLKVLSATITEDFSAEIKTGSNLNKELPIKVAFDNRVIYAPLDWRLIDRFYAYDGDDLGCTVNENEALFKLWAPLAEKVSLCLYDKENQTKLLLEKPMNRGDRGVWHTKLKVKEVETSIDSLIGYYYQYTVKNPGKKAVQVLDPYARSMAPVTVDSEASDGGSAKDLVGKAAIVDLNEIEPRPSLVKIEGCNSREDAIIYEVHVRDFVSDPRISDRLTGRFGSFKAFMGRIPYLKSLGVTHIQLLPIMAWYYGDELKMAEPEYAFKARGCNYNWGYDPHNYFSIDGAYSEDPAKAELRISEFRQLINAIHNEGMGVILDVVYTHMANGNFLNDIVPDYYFFKDKNGNFVGDFGNNLATTRKMASKLMIDSVKHWFREYGIDGMRWDMMGDATADSVQACFDEAKKINPNLIFIGEGWRTFKGDQEDPALKGKGADQDWLYKTFDVSSFSDEMRNEMKSGFMSEGEPAFISGGPRNIKKIFNNIKGRPTNFKTSSPGSVVQYIEAHDNLTAFDVVAMATKLDPEEGKNFLELHKRIRLGMGFVLTSQGTAFIHAGQEYGRTKQWLGAGIPEQKYFKMVNKDGNPFKHPYFIHDSYDSSDAINKFDWTKATNKEKSPISCDSVEYAKGLIALRKSTDAFRLGSIKSVDENVKLLEIPEIGEEDLAIAYSCTSVEKGETYYIFANCDSVEREFSVDTDLTKDDVVVDSAKAGIKKIQAPTGIKIAGKKLTLDPLTFAVIRKKGKEG